MTSLVIKPSESSPFRENDIVVFIFHQSKMKIASIIGF